jgi:hypothetical protein
MKAVMTVLLVAAFAPTGAAARQHVPAEREAFMRQAAAAAERYADRREAIADGFRRIGPDFPGMGVHWIHTSRIVGGELVGDRPSVLCYVEIDGKQTLVGLAYTLPLAGDESPPVEPFGVEVWHDHSGQVTEESLLLNHPSSVTASDPTFRLSMVHVWMPLANPDGLLVQNNWAIPWLRAGIEPPETPEAGPARGLSLGSTGVDYYRELLYWAAEMDPSERAIVDEALARRAREVDDWVGIHAEGWSDDDLLELERIWNDLWDDLEAELDPAVYERIIPLQADVQPEHDTH